MQPIPTTPQPQTSARFPPIITSITRMMPSLCEWQQLYTLSNLDFVTQSSTLTAGKGNSPLAAISFRRRTPVRHDTWRCFFKGLEWYCKNDSLSPPSSPKVSKPINLRLWGITRAAEQNVLRLLQPRFQLLLLSLSPTPLFVHPALHTAPPPHKRSLNQQKNLGFSSPFARPRSLTQLQREEVKQTCGKAKRADPSQNGIIMPIFWEGHQGFRAQSGQVRYTKAVWVSARILAPPTPLYEIGSGRCQNVSGASLRNPQTFFVAGLNSGLSRPAVRLVNGVRNTSLVSPPGVSDEELVRKSWAWLSVQTQSSPTKFSTRGESLIIASSSNLLVIAFESLTFAVEDETETMCYKVL